MEKILLYLAVKYKGNWDEIYTHISTKKDVSIDEVNSFYENYKGSKAVTIIDEEYPQCLKNIYNPPFVLFYKGNFDLLNDKKKIAVIGSRQNSSYGEKVCNDLVSGLVDNNIVIVSGLAKGIDGIAHKAVIDHMGKTIAVVANGLDCKYPKSNSKLFDDIIDYNGLIISEYPDGIEPTKDKFNIRNRLIAGLSNQVLVIEAHSKSGTLLTVKHALSYNKDIFCVPNSIYSDSVCNKLIKDGAKLVENIDDILDEM